MSYKDYSLEELLELMRPKLPLKVEAVRQNRRHVEHGLHTVGIKLHCMDQKHGLEPVTEALYCETRPFRHEKSFLTVVLPAFGSVRTAIQFLECLEEYCECRIFGNQYIYIQACSPCRLSPHYATALAILFYLGSDVLQEYSLDDLATTFSRDERWDLSRGRRLVLYDGNGPLDTDYEWWACGDGALPTILPKLPFNTDRTDVLTCRTKIDLQNVNLVATLLGHSQKNGYWDYLGRHLMKDFTEIMQRHQLHGLLDVHWVHPGNGTIEDDKASFAALQELMSYALEEYRRLQSKRFAVWKKAPEHPSILAEVAQLLRMYRELVKKECERLAREERA